MPWATKYWSFKSGKDIYQGKRINVDGTCLPGIES